MEFEILKEKMPDIRYKTAEVSFPSFAEYREQAKQIAEYIDSLDVTPENVKEVKAILAQARKVTDGLNRKRIDLKKSILGNFAEFESQVTELSGIIDTADRKVRAMVKEIEDGEREAKRTAIREIWDKRVKQYPILIHVIDDPFSRWLTEKMLNKSTSMKTVEESMVAWMEKVEQEADTAKGMGEEFLLEYAACLDLTRTINTIQKKKEIEQKIKTHIEPKEDAKATFIVFGEKDIRLAEILMNSNDINFRRI